MLDKRSKLFTKELDLVNLEDDYTWEKAKKDAEFFSKLLENGLIQDCFDFTPAPEVVEIPKAVQAWMLNRVNNGEFNCLCNALVESRRLVEEEIEGIQFMLDPATEETWFGISTVKAWDKNGQAQWIVKGGDMIYRFNIFSDDCRKSAIKKAIAVWKKQQHLEKSFQKTRNLYFIKKNK